MTFGIEFAKTLLENLGSCGCCDGVETYTLTYFVEVGETVAVDTVELTFGEHEVCVGKAEQGIIRVRYLRAIVIAEVGVVKCGCVVIVIFGGVGVLDEHIAAGVLLVGSEVGNFFLIVAFVDEAAGVAFKSFGELGTATEARPWSTEVVQFFQLGCKRGVITISFHIRTDSKIGGTTPCLSEADALGNAPDDFSVAYILVVRGTEKILILGSELKTGANHFLKGIGTFLPHSLAGVNFGVEIKLGEEHVAGFT